MELSLSLGDASKPFGFLGNNNSQKEQRKNRSFNNGGLDFCMDLRLSSYEERKEAHKSQENDEDEEENSVEITPVQLSLLPLSPVPHRISSHLWSSGSSENGSSANMGLPAAKGWDVSRLLPPPTAAEEASSANSVGSTMYRNGNLLSGSKRDFEGTGNDVVEADRTSSKASDDDEIGLNTRKKLRLSKEQSAFLEESFKEHSTLNPKQKLAIAKQLNLRPRQVEVWFQNRRARTKLKQTELDCEYLKRCCETLTEENRRLQKELQELRALKTSNPFYMQSPATTLTMCPSCERVASTTTAAASQPRMAASANGKTKSSPFTLTPPRFYPFTHTTPHPNQPAAS